MNGEMPGLPNLGFNLVDVRDVADLHIRAMTDPKANGERFMAVADDSFKWTKDMTHILKNRLGDKAKNVPTRTVPNLVIRMVALVSKLMCKRVTLELRGCHFESHVPIYCVLFD